MQFFVLAYSNMHHYCVISGLGLITSVLDREVMFLKRTFFCFIRQKRQNESVVFTWRSKALCQVPATACGCATLTANMWLFGLRGPRVAAACRLSHRGARSLGGR